MKTVQERYQFRKQRVQEKLSRHPEKPRLAVYRSLKHLYAQVIDDMAGRTLAFASSLSKEVREKVKSGKNIQAARLVGELIARKAMDAGVQEVRFDRAGCLYHGRIKALAEAAREAGLKF